MSGPAPGGDRPGPDDLVGGPPEREPRSAAAQRGWRAAGLVLAVALGVAVVVPRLSLHADGGPPAARRGTPTAPETGRPPAGAAVLDWPLRGNLTDDTEFVRLGISWLATERPHVSRALLAETLPDGSRLLLAGMGVPGGTDAATVSALHVPVGASITDGAVSDMTGLSDPQQALGWATRGADRTTYAVVLAAPRPMRLQASARVDFDDQGFASRRWTTAGTEDGVVVVPLRAPGDPSVAVRSLNALSFASPVLVPVTGIHRTPPSSISITGVSDPAYVGPELGFLQAGLAVSTTDLLDLGRTTQRVLWSGVPWAGRHYALVLIRRPDGLRFQALVGEQAGGWFPAGVRALPADAPDEVPWLLEPFTPQDPTFLLCPTGEGHLRYRHNGNSATFVVHPSGIVALLEPAPRPPDVHGAQVAVFSARGRRLFTTTLPPTGFDDPLALDRT